jgi:hypothetical protein
LRPKDVKNNAKDEFKMIGKKIHLSFQSFQCLEANYISIILLMVLQLQFRIQSFNQIFGFRNLLEENTFEMKKTFVFLICIVFCVCVGGGI